MLIAYLSLMQLSLAMCRNVELGTVVIILRRFINANLISTVDWIQILVYLYFMCRASDYIRVLTHTALFHQICFTGI